MCFQEKNTSNNYFSCCKTNWFVEGESKSSEVEMEFVTDINKNAKTEYLTEMEGQITPIVNNSCPSEIMGVHFTFIKDFLVNLLLIGNPYRNCVISRPPPQTQMGYTRLKLFFRSEIFSWFS